MVRPLFAAIAAGGLAWFASPGWATAQSECPVLAIGVPGLVIFPECPIGGPRGDLAVPAPRVPVALIGRDDEGNPVPIGVVEPAVPPAPPFEFPSQPDAGPSSAPSAGPTEALAPDCNPAYRECLPDVADLDCVDIGFRQIELVDPADDPYGLDGVATVEDGITCNNE